MELFWARLLVGMCNSKENFENTSLLIWVEVHTKYPIIFDGRDRDDIIYAEMQFCLREGITETNDVDI